MCVFKRDVRYRCFSCGFHASGGLLLLSEKSKVPPPPPTGSRLDFSRSPRSNPPLFGGSLGNIEPSKALGGGVPGTRGVVYHVSPKPPQIYDFVCITRRRGANTAHTQWAAYPLGTYATAPYALTGDAAACDILNECARGRFIHVTRQRDRSAPGSTRPFLRAMQASPHQLSPTQRLR